MCLYFLSIAICLSSLLKILLLVSDKFALLKLLDLGIESV